MSEKIKIAERDLSVQPASNVTSSDIVFIPGTSRGLKTGLSVNEPVLCTTLEEFRTAFGATIPSATATGSSATVYDKGYIMATELLNLGMPVLYAATATTFTGTAPSINDTLKTKLKDKGEYNIKYLTLGGYDCVSSTTSTHTILTDIAESRGDSVALVDPATATTNTITNVTATVKAACATTSAKYASVFYPAGKYKLPACDLDDVDMPASFGYLLCLAKAIKTGPNWLAMAGVNRGLVPYLKSLNVPVSNKDAEDCQPKTGAEGGSVSINCITNIKPYGYSVWGNRTALALKKDEKLSQSHFLNVRNMVSDIKKVMFTTAKECMFEQNTDTLWLRFKGGITPLLNQLKLGNALYDYKVIKTNFRTDGKTALGRGELGAIVKIYPINAVEFFELSVEIADNDVAVN